MAKLVFAYRMPPEFTPGKPETLTAWGCLARHAMRPDRRGGRPHGCGVDQWCGMSTD